MVTFAPKYLQRLLNKPVRFFGICLCVTLVTGFLLAFSPMSSDAPKCKPEPKRSLKVPHQMGIAKHHRRSQQRHHLAVLVPYRDRFEELLEFAPHMNKFLSKQGITHKIYILNQVDNFRFNRASLINAGFLISRAESDYVAMHDVDLLPMNDELSYQYPIMPGPFHIASPELHPRYHYATFVGGILLIRREDFELVNGMSNKYWGWGLEDDEFYVRLKEAGLNVSRPLNISTGTHNTFRHIHDRTKRKRDMEKCFNQREVTRRRDRETGLHNVVYDVDSQHDVTIDGASITIVNIKLKCDRSSTPWCICNEFESGSSKNLPEPTPRIKVDKKSTSRHSESVIVPNVKNLVKHDNLNGISK